MNGMGSPLKLKVMLVEKRRTWEKNGRQGAIYQLYGQLHNENPSFPLYLVVSAPVHYPITPGAVIDVPISGLTISLGDPVSSSSGFDFDVPFDVIKDKEKK
ncbi:MAG: hypothetical protein ACP5P0_05400 [Hydrogenobacter sp.]